MEAALGAGLGGLTAIVFAMGAILWRNGNGRRDGTLEAKMDEALLVLREIATILKERR